MPKYEWTISARNKENIHRVTDAEELEETLRILKLPGEKPTQWAWVLSENPEWGGQGRFVHNAGGEDEWSLTWSKIDEPKMDTEH